MATADGNASLTVTAQPRLAAAAATAPVPEKASTNRPPVGSPAISTIRFASRALLPMYLTPTATSPYPATSRSGHARVERHRGEGCQSHLSREWSGLIFHPEDRSRPDSVTLDLDPSPTHPCPSNGHPACLVSCTRLPVQSLSGTGQLQSVEDNDIDVRRQQRLQLRTTTDLRTPRSDSIRFIEEAITRARTRQVTWHLALKGLATQSAVVRRRGPTQPTDVSRRRGGQPPRFPRSGSGGCSPRARRTGRGRSRRGRRPPRPRRRP